MAPPLNVVFTFLFPTILGQNICKTSLRDRKGDFYKKSPFFVEMYKSTIGHNSKLQGKLFT